METQALIERIILQFSLRVAPMIENPKIKVVAPENPKCEISSRELFGQPRKIRNNNSSFAEIEKMKKLLKIIGSGYTKDGLRDIQKLIIKKLILKNEIILNQIRQNVQKIVFPNLREIIAQNTILQNQIPEHFRYTKKGGSFLLRGVEGFQLNALQPRELGAQPDKTNFELEMAKHKIDADAFFNRPSENREPVEMWKIEVFSKISYYKMLRKQAQKILRSPDNQNIVINKLRWAYKKKES